MISVGMYVRCPIDLEFPKDPRTFATGKVKSINTFSETAHIVFLDPFNYKDIFEYIPHEVKEAPVSTLEHCHLFKRSKVKYQGQPATVIEYKKREDDYYDYYLQFENSKEFLCVGEEDIEGSFFSGMVTPSTQLSHYEFQNPSWYLGRQVVAETMNILNNSIFGFKELAGCKIYLKAFQVNTIMRCIQGQNCRYMIADEVGLGKTIEACSVLKIYMSNKAQKNILIAAPKALVAQWKTELLFKFGIINGLNDNGNNVTIKSVEEIGEKDQKHNWDFVVVDEVHNYINNEACYELIHKLSLCSENILLLSATPIQQRREEFYRLLCLILPQKYDKMSLEEFIHLSEKQARLTRLMYELLDEVNSFKTELLPEISENHLYDDEDVIDEIEEITGKLKSLAAMIDDDVLKNMIDSLDMQKDDFGLYDIQVVSSYICENYQIEKNIIRGRRSVLGVYPKDEEGEFAERNLVELSYDINEDKNYYEYDAYFALNKWIVDHQTEIDDEIIEKEIKPLLEAFFSSPWAYFARVNQLSEKNNFVSREVLETAKKWADVENEKVENLSNALDELESYSSRLLEIVNYIETELYGKKVVVFTDQAETFDKYYEVLQQAFGEEVTGFAKTLDKDQAEINIYRFQSDSKCKILLSDKSGGEGRNLQMADYIIHVDLPWDINVIEQRIGRLDRMGRNVRIPVTSIVVHTSGTYEEQLFKFWNEGLNVFHQSLSGLEIIMNDISRKITESIKTDFEYGLYNLIPELIKDAKNMRELVRREQLFDTAALRYKPLYNQLRKLLDSYQMNENSLFSNTMMSWASLAGFKSGPINHEKRLVTFDENSFSLKSALNSYLIPPDWNSYMNKKQNEIAIRVQRGLEEEKKKNISHNHRKIIGTFDRDIAIKNDYIHFYSPGDEIFDCITENALQSYKGMSTAFAAKSSFDWKGFIYTYSIEPNVRLLLDHGFTPSALGLLRQYLANSIQVVAIPFRAYSEIDEKKVITEHKRIIQRGATKSSKEVDHLGKRSMKGGFLDIPLRYHVSNAEWFKGQYSEEKWNDLVTGSSKMAKKCAKERFQRESNLKGAREMIEQIISSAESRELFYGNQEEGYLKQLKAQYDIIYSSLKSPIIRLESACFMWLMK